MLHELKEQLIGYLQPVLDWMSSLGEMGLFILAFTESSFFPIPPDFLYIPMILNGANNPYMLAFIASLGSVLGAIFGYGIGYFGGRPIIEFVLGKHSAAVLQKAEDFFSRYGSMAVLIAAFTPIPFKVFTLAGGLAKMPLIPFTLYSVLGRAGRFFAVTFLLVNFGEIIMENFFKLSLLVVLVVLITVVFIKKSKSAS